tara:strand:+ start:226 stop:780 length:555 start_codon:yes stop_codon:yes gene_type:complete
MKFTKRKLKQIIKEEINILINENRDDNIYEQLKDLVSNLETMSQGHKDDIIGQAEGARAQGTNKARINIWIAQTLAKAYRPKSSVQRKLDSIMRQGVNESAFSGNGPLSEPIEEVVGEGLDLIDTLFYDVKDALDEGDSLKKIFKDALKNRAEPLMTHHYDLENISNEEIWKAILTIKDMPDED